MTRHAVALVGLAVGVCLVGPAAGDGRAGSADDRERIQGRWECIATLKDGQQVKDYVGVVALMQGDRLTWIFPKPGGASQTVKARFQLDPDQNPKYFDWYTEAKPSEVHKRLYVLEDDVLIWSTNLGSEARPESFTAGHWQFIMKRVKKSD